MICHIASSFTTIENCLREYLVAAPAVRTERWQGMDVSQNPAATTYELRNCCFEVDLDGNSDLDHWRQDIRPNLPWADDHFLERVGGEPLNPGVQWANWPWARSAAGFKTDRFNHTYMERLWPKYARRTPDGKLPIETAHPRKYPGGLDKRPLFGVAHHLGDLQDLVELLAAEPYTRQAWIPLFFPEDTGRGDGGRKPCTLGYQIMVRGTTIDCRTCGGSGWQGHGQGGDTCSNCGGTKIEKVNRAHIWYPLRSCDFVRHWRDDCYLAVRLLLWIMEQCRDLSPNLWGGIEPGTFAMHCTSLHIFENDKREQAALLKDNPVGAVAGIA